MKKLLGMLTGIVVLIGFGSTTVAADCLDVRFDNGDSVCVALQKSSNSYYANVQSTSLSSTLRDVSLSCEMLLPNNVLVNLGACNGYFSYASTRTENVRLYVRYDNRYYQVVDTTYNFNNGNWGSSSGGGGYYGGNITVSSNRTSPSTNEWVNLTVRTNSSYQDYVYFSLEYRDGYTRRSASSSDYNADSYFNNGYRFSYSDYGEKTFNSFIRFYRNAQYRLYVKDYNGNRNYVEFNVGGGSSSDSSISISTNRSAPNTNERVNATVNTDSNYRGRVTFSLQYRSSTSSNWSTISDSSYYFTASSDYSNGYRFSSSDYGYKTFSSFISFKQTGYYRLYARNDSGRESYVEYTVGGGSYGGNITVSSNRTSPSTNEWVNLTVRTNSSYQDYVYFSLEYLDGYTRRSASSSDYNADNYFNNGYRFTYSDYGEKTFNSFIRFYRNAQYRLYVKDYNGNRSYVEFTVGGGSSSDSSISVSTNRSAPNTNERVNATVSTDSNYRGRVTFSLQYRSSTSSNWSTISDSSYYFTASSDYSNGYRFSSSDYGYKTFSSFISFKQTGYYRLYARNDSGRESYVEYTVGGGGSYGGNVTVSSNRTSPSTNEWVNLTVRTNSSYQDYVYFSLEYRDGYTRRSASYSDYNADSYFNNGYRFTYSDYGERTFNSFIRFYRNAQYRLYVKDYNGNRNYVEFTVGGGGSSVNGFTSSELRRISNVSNVWNTAMGELKRQSSRLRNDTYWQRLSDTLYNNMRDVVNNRSSRTFYSWRDFLDAFNEWFKYTSRNS